MKSILRALWCDATSFFTLFAVIICTSCAVISPIAQPIFWFFAVLMFIYLWVAIVEFNSNDNE